MREGKFNGFDVSVESPGIAWIRFNEPEKLNGMTTLKKRDLIETLTQAQMDNNVRVIVFIGEGRGFCAGDDLKTYFDESSQNEGLVEPIPAGHKTPIGTYDGLRHVSQALNLTVRKLDKLCIAAVNGFAIQSGLSLALACDFKIAATSARFGSATLRFACLPDEGGQFLLMQHLGLAQSMDFLMRKRIVNAEEALQLGLVTEVVADDELEEHVRRLAHELAAGPQVSMRLLKRSLYASAELSFEQACEDIAAKTAVSDHHPDATEGVRAFYEKEEPVFNAWLND